MAASSKSRSARSKKGSRARASSKMRPEKLVEFLEAAYAVEMEDEPWLRGVSVAIRDVWGRPGSIFSSFFDVSDVMNLRPMFLVTEGIPTELASILLQSRQLVTPDLMARVFRYCAAGTVREVAPELVPALSETSTFGLADSLGIFGTDPSGIICAVTLGTSERIELDERDLGVYKRMAFHLGAAFRCRRRLRASPAPADPSSGAEAILDPAGRVVHAEGPAKRPNALAGLREAVRRFDSARARGRHTDPVAGLARHHPLIEARWTLVDAYERGGARYVVARENQAAVRGLATLTERERQVVGLLVLGRTTKEIAYLLGISDSTTRVLLSRAAVRLRARTRRELVSLATREAFPGLAGLEAPAPASPPAPNGNGRSQGDGTRG